MRPDIVLPRVVSGPLWIGALAVVVASVVAPAAAAPGAAAAGSLPAYLATFGVDRAARSLLEEPLAWDESKQRLALRVLARLQLAPAERLAAWEADASPLAEASADLPGDRFVRLTGRALFVAPADLPADDALAAGMPRADLVRVRAGDGRVVDVLAAATPQAWPRWRLIDEPASVVGLPLAVDAGPVPHDDGPRDDGSASAWPDGAPAVLLAAGRVAWHPDTPLGRAGMDYGWFDTVADGRSLTAADGDAFYGALAAVARADAIPAGPAPSITELIDPGQRWFTRHRGDVVTVAGICRRATRIEIDDPLRAGSLGLDHYWELFVFVDTPLLQVHDQVHDTYPVVCCVRELPTGMPTGQAIGERVRLTGFGFKRYAYPLPPGAGAAPRRLEVPLIVARAVEWLPGPRARAWEQDRGPGLLPLAGLVATIMLVGGWWLWWRGDRDRSRRRTALPDRVRLPEDGAGS
jgi:hypothetical protein